MGRCPTRENSLKNRQRLVKVYDRACLLLAIKCPPTHHDRSGYDTWYYRCLRVRIQIPVIKIEFLPSYHLVTFFLPLNVPLRVFEGFWSFLKWVVSSKLKSIFYKNILENPFDTSPSKFFVSDGFSSMFLWKWTLSRSKN